MIIFLYKLNCNFGRYSPISRHIHSYRTLVPKLFYFEWSPPWHFKAYIWPIFWHTYFLTFYQTFYLTSILPFFLAFYLAHILAFYVASVLAFYLIYLRRFFVVEVRQGPLWSWACCSGPAGTTAIASLQLRSGRDRSDPGLAITSLQLRFGGEHSDLGLAVRVQPGPLPSRASSWGPAEKKEEEKEAEEEEEEASWHKI